MKNTKIEQLIEDIIDFVESCRMQPLSSTKVVVPKDELYDLLDELRLRTPDEVKRYQKIIANRDAILDDAREKAEIILEEARQKKKEIISEHEITQQAYFEANQMVKEASEAAQKIYNDADNDSNHIMLAALSYSNDVLLNVEQNLARAYETSRNQYDGFLNTLKDNLSIVANNRKEIEDQLSPKADKDDSSNYDQDNQEYDNEINEDDYDFDEDTFLNNID